MTGNTPSSWRDSVGQLARAGLKSILNNWPLKLLSFLLAVLLWAGLISQDPTLTREKLFTDVTISVTGAESIKRNGFIVVSGLENLEASADIRVDVPQMQYEAAQGSYYNPRIDLTRITQTGTQEIKVSTTNSTAYGTVSDIEPESLTITVEEYITRYRIPLTVDVVGNPPDGFYATTPSLDPPVVAVSGPRSAVEKIVRAEAVLDQSTLPAREGLVRSAVAFALLDEQGNPVESDLVEVTSESVLLDSVIVEQNLYAMKTLHMEDLSLVTGEVAKGYEIKSIAIEPETVVAAARQENLDVLDTLFIEAPVDATDRNRSFHEQVRVRRPSELIYLSSDSVTVSVEIGPIIKDKTFEDVKVSLTGVGDGLRGSAEKRYANVTITGEQLWVDKLRASALTLTLDASGLAAGEYDLPVVCKVSTDEDQIFTVTMNPETIHVTITER